MFRVIYPNRWFIWTIVACLVVGVLVWWQVALYSLDQELANILAPEPHRKVALTGVDTAGWKTYRNEKYGFEFKYPQSLRVSGSLADDYIFALGNDTSSIGIIKIPKESVSEYIISGTKHRQEYKAFLENCEGCGVHELIGSEPTKFTFLNKDAVLEENVVGIGFSGKIIAFPNDGFLLQINEDADLNNIADDFSNKILETFKFFEPIDTSTWKTYRNEEYGFEFMYPPTVRVVKEKSSENFLSSFDLVTVDTEAYLYPTFSVQNPNYASTHGYCGDNGKYYPEIGMFLADFDCRPHLVPWCTNTKLGKDHIPAWSSSFGEAGGGAATNIIFTNKGYAIRISRSLQVCLDCFDETEEEITKVKVMQEEVEKILGSFKLIGDTAAKDLKCDIPFSGSLPTMIFPTTGTIVRDDNALSVKLSGIIPESYGALIYVTENYESGLPNYRFDLGEINAGGSELSVLSILQVAKERAMGSPHAATGGNWIHAHFYKIIGDKKVMFNEKYNAKVQINLINTNSE